ncbi:amino acid ABC transporter permease [Helicobacter aurati]|uniref:Amino acid ABC transporter permease n=2 Tax=Helicobacter aurati TaxID=137778 RepID=A0A3D8J8I0_9HELI|nr:amino acid ABC transporter permease [Helicobacter aurati]
MYFFQTANVLLPSLPLTFFIAFVSFCVGSLLGLLMALARIYNIPIIKQAVILFVSFFRATPLLVQLLIFYYGIPIFLKNLDMQIDISNIEAIYYALVVFSLYASAYLCEIFRSAILAVDKGQLEAAYSIGMNEYQVLKRIILPQAVMITLPNLLNFFILQLKNTSLCSIITVPELMGVADIEAGRSSKFLEAYCMAALLYWSMCVVLEALFFRLEKIAQRYKKRYL